MLILNTHTSYTGFIHANLFVFLMSHYNALWFVPTQTTHPPHRALRNITSHGNMLCDILNDCTTFWAKKGKLRHTIICWENVEGGGSRINYIYNYCIAELNKTLLQSPVTAKTNHNNITLYPMTCMVVSTNQHHNIYTTITSATGRNKCQSQSHQTFNTYMHWSHM